MTLTSWQRSGQAATNLKVYVCVSHAYMQVAKELVNLTQLLKAGILFQCHGQLSSPLMVDLVIAQI